MLDKLKNAEEKYLGIEKALEDPAVVSDAAQFSKLMKEYKSLTPIIEKYRELMANTKAMNDAYEMMNDRESAELYDLAKEEFKAAKENATRLENELRVMLLPRDENDDRNVMVEIRAGTGGDEAALFAADLFRMYSTYASLQGFSVSLMNANETELGGFREVTFLIEGEGAFSRFKFESGVHRVQRVPKTESQGRIQTSAATVAVLPEAEDIEIELNPADLVFESCKSSGAGGQHINKTESAIRLTHKPTGIVVECQEERSQFKNKDKALKMLKTKLYHIKQTEQQDRMANQRKSQVGSGDRSEKIRTYNFPQSRVTDHRIGYSTFNIEGFMAGDIGDMIDALIAHDTAEKLASEI